MCLTFHLLTSLCMQTTKALKRLLNFVFEQATPADICSIVFMKKKIVSHVLHSLLRQLMFDKHVFQKFRFYLT